jgi:acyl dehydratase
MIEVFQTPATDRFFEDYKVGSTYNCGSFTVTEAEIIAFASEYDPQAMHVDPDLAAKGPFGELIASGWHTIAKTMRLMVDQFLPHNGLAAPGIDELRWPRPVRPGDTLTLYATVQEARRSQSKPDRGLLHVLLEVRNPVSNV